MTLPPTLDDIVPTLLRLGARRRLPAGHVLIEQGRHDRSVFYLLGGTVEVVRDGSRVASICAGDVVGEYAFMDNRPRTASVRTLEPVDLIELERDTLLRAAGEDLGFLSRFLGVLSERMRSREAPLQERRGKQEWVDALEQEALSHPALTHPYLQALAGGDLPDLRWALADFARQYYGYSAHFPRFLAQTISQLTDPVHRSGLLVNLTEESGEYGAEELDELKDAGIEPEWIVGVPHPQLFSRFCASMGVDLDAPNRDAVQVICWREMFLEVLGAGSPAQAVGALGLGTESIVSTMYQHFLPPLERLGIPPRDAVFFPLHAMVDDRHQATLLEIAVHFAGTPEGRRDLEKGMHKALFLRSGFWDWMLRRATDPSAAGVQQ